MALTKSGFVLRSTTALLQASIILTGKRVELSSGERYTVNDTDLGSGLLLAGGNYANPISSLGSVIPQTTSGTLTAGGQENQFRDSGSFDMPLANSVDADTILVANLPDTYAAQTPSLTRSGSDEFKNKDGTDTVVNWVGAAKLTFTSNGVDEWSL